MKLLICVVTFWLILNSASGFFELEPRANLCQYQTGNGTCLPSTSCAGTNVTGYCSGPRTTQCCVRTCDTPDGPGFCSSTSTPCTGGSYVPGHCPGAANIQCCVSACSVQGVAGTCQWTGSPCDGGSYVSGYCPGPADVECCIGSTTNTTATGLLGIDISAAAPASFWSCAAAAYQVVAIEGYIQGCRIGGEINANFLSNYKAANAASFSRIDAYLFPCTGTQSNNVSCKDPSVQLVEFLTFIDSNNMNISHYWFDLEPTPGGQCDAWNLGNDANAALARQWTALMQASGRPWGVYANPDQWTSMFASLSTDVASQLPLWKVQVDGIPGLNTLTAPGFGGWTSAAAKQYQEGESILLFKRNLLIYVFKEVTSCGWTAGVDLDSFT